MNLYRPFSKATDFQTIHEGSVLTGLNHSRLGYQLAWPLEFQAPRTAVLMCSYLDVLNLRKQRILDVGTGSAAILAIHSSMLGAGTVLGIDSNEHVIPSAKSNVKINGLDGKVMIEKGDVFGYQCDRSIDLIIANLPHMPVKTNRSRHDDGGVDGRMCITALLSLAKRCLAIPGSILFTAPDYLGVNKCYGDRDSIRDIAARHGLRLRIARRYKMEVRAGSYTAKNLGWIKQIYPRYGFGMTNDGTPTYSLLIVAAEFSGILDASD